jgi:hypothetical protein
VNDDSFKAVDQSFQVAFVDSREFSIPNPFLAISGGANPLEGGNGSRPDWTTLRQYSSEVTFLTEQCEYSAYKRH